MASACARARICAPILLMLFLFGCGDDPSRPGGGDDGQFVGTIDPTGESVVLQKLVGPNLLPLELIATGEVRVDPQLQQVAIDVALRNVGSESLMAPVVVLLGRFNPDDVVPINSDWPRIAATTPVELEYPWGFVYAEEFGSDELLEPGETSATREWIFFDPDLASFSFGARAELAGTPDDAAITGVVFVDDNFNGVFDDFELPHGIGAVYSTSAGGAQLIAPVAPDGSYRFPISRTGIYELYYDDFTDGPWCTSTPNPLRVLITPGPNGEPTSFEDANFGWSARCGPNSGDVIFTDRPLSEFAGDQYFLNQATADGNSLVVDVGFSGCGGGHPFTLVISNHIMESFPPQTFAVLVHDGRGELCAAFFEEERRYDLSGLVQRVGGSIYIRLLDYGGIEHTVLVGGDKGDG